MPVKSKAMVADPGYRGGYPAPGQNDAQRHADAFSFGVDLTMLTKGKSIALGEFGGPQVGPPYDADALGEERAMITHTGKGK
jgi:hypothetical protein